MYALYHIFCCDFGPDWLTEWVAPHCCCYRYVFHDYDTAFVTSQTRFPSVRSFCEWVSHTTLAVVTCISDCEWRRSWCFRGFNAYEVVIVTMELGFRVASKPYLNVGLITTITGRFSMAFTFVTFCHIYFVARFPWVTPALQFWRWSCVCEWRYIRCFYGSNGYEDTLVTIELGFWVVSVSVSDKELNFHVYDGESCGRVTSQPTLYYLQFWRWSCVCEWRYIRCFYGSNGYEGTLVTIELGFWVVSVSVSDKGLNFHVYDGESCGRVTSQPTLYYLQ